MLKNDLQPITDEIAITIIARLDEFLKRTQKSAAWASRSMGIAASTLSQILTRTYAADSDPHLRAIDKWLEQQICKESAPKPMGFVKIGVAERIYAVAKWMLDTNGIGVIHGPAGVGKTRCLQAVRSDTPGSIFMSIITAGQSKLGVLETLAQAMHIPSGIKFTSRQLHQQIEALLKDSGRLIIVDECHKLVEKRKDEGLHALRDLHDATGCPMILSGMSNLANYIQMGRCKYEPLDQLASRVKYWLDLSEAMNRTDGGDGLYTPQDISRAIAAMKIRIAPDAERYLLRLANEPMAGALRTVCDCLLRFAQKVAGEKIITLEMLCAIRRQQLGIGAADRIEHMIDEREKVMARAG